VVRNGSSSRTQFLPKRPRKLRRDCGGNFLAFISTENWLSESADLKLLNNKLWAVLEDMAWRKCHNSLESLRRSLVKAVAEIPLEMEHVVTAEWSEGLKACVEA